MDWIKSIARNADREQMALAMEALGATVFPLPAPDEAAGERQRP